MRYKKLRLVITVFLLITCQASAQLTQKVDICIYGGTSAGVMAAYTASKLGKSVVLIEPSTRLGGLSTGGLGYTDIGNKYVVRGLALDLYRNIGQHYGKLEQWIFEPKVALNIFNEYIKKANVKVIYQQVLTEVKKNANAISQINTTSTSKTSHTNYTIIAKVFIDCSYEGDLMAKAGVSYLVGREASTVYNESLNGAQLLEGHQFPEEVDPYVVPGNPKSGLLWGINKGNIGKNGSGDKKVQAYNFRITLTNNPKNMIPISKPERYDPTHYELLRRMKTKSPWTTLEDIFIWSHMPNHKTDINNRNGFSTDMIGMNWDYPEADYHKRQEIIQKHVDYTKGLLYFVGNDPSVPDFIKKEMRSWGYPKDEYIHNGNWSSQLYIREARRMVGELVMTQAHCEGRETVTDEIGFAAYNMDSHNCDRLVVNGMVKNEGNVEVGGFPPYPISYRAIVPQQKQANNLIVPVCVSASHIAFGSIRMEPIFMVLSQSAAIAASIAIDQKCAVQSVKADLIKSTLMENPKADGRIPDLLIASGSTDDVMYSGKWESATKGGFGRSYKIAADLSVVSTAKFTTQPSHTGAYDVYYYYPKLLNSSEQLHFKIFDGKNNIEKEISLKNLKIEGQTSGEWVHLADLMLTSEQKTYVEVSNVGSNGVVPANAVVYVPKPVLNHK